MFGKKHTDRDLLDAALSGLAAGSLLGMAVAAMSAIAESEEAALRRVHRRRALNWELRRAQRQLDAHRPLEAADTLYGTDHGVIKDSWGRYSIQPR